MDNPSTYFKSYRNKMGFSTQNKTKDFLAAKNILPSVDYKYIEALNFRIKAIIEKINSVIHKSVKRKDLSSFFKIKIDKVYKLIKKNELIPKLNNQGRRPENVLFSWMRGYVISEYFTPVISMVFDVEIDSVMKIGDDDFRNQETFRRTPQADLQLQFKDLKIRIEVQSGFQGVNDIKQHKVLEAKKIFRDAAISTVCIHFDLYNGQVAFIRLDNINDNDVNWVTRQQMEGQTVFSIDQNYFFWRLLEPVPDIYGLDIL